MSTGREILNDFFQEEHTIFKEFLAASLTYTGRPRKIGQFFTNCNSFSSWPSVTKDIN